MFRPLPTRTLKSKLFWVGILGVMLICLCVAYGLSEPRSSAGRTVFHAGYALPRSRPQFLRFYRWSLAEFEGSYLPSEVDDFLIRRLSLCHGTPEWAAIIDLQLAHSSASWGSAASQADDTLKAQIIAYLIPTLETASPSEALTRMEFIESLRRNDPLHKGGFAWMDFYYQPDPRGPSTLRRDQLGLAVGAFQQWWGDGSRWPDNKSLNPLAGTKISIHHGP